MKNIAIPFWIFTRSGQERQSSINTEKLDLPSISQVQSRLPSEIPFYNHHSAPRPFMSVDRLPNLHLPQSYPVTSSSGVSRIGSLDSSSNYPSSQYLPPLTSTSSYPAISSGIGLKTPISSPGTHQISILGDRAGEDSSHNFSHQPQPPHSYPGEGAYSNSMIQSGQGWDSQQNSMASHAPYPTPPQASSAQYPQYQPSQHTLPGPAAYHPSGYGPYGYANGVTSPQSAGLPVSAPHLAPQMLPLPGNHMPNSHLGPLLIPLAGMPPAQYGSGQGYPSQAFDTTGQIAPQGVKPRVTATLWEDEGSLCFQVEVKGVCVARREGTIPQNSSLAYASRYPHS